MEHQSVGWQVEMKSQATNAEWAADDGLSGCNGSVLEVEDERGSVVYAMLIA
jgi:hypothetical protein